MKVGNERTANRAKKRTIGMRRMRKERRRK
jgi:hypothetical protein